MVALTRGGSYASSCLGWMFRQAQQLQLVEEETVSRIPNQKTDWTACMRKDADFRLQARYVAAVAAIEVCSCFECFMNAGTGIPRLLRCQVYAEGAQHGHAMFAGQGLRARRACLRFLAEGLGFRTEEIWWLSRDCLVHSCMSCRGYVVYFAIPEGAQGKDLQGFIQPVHRLSCMAHRVTRC